MLVKATRHHISSIPESVRKYAFGQDQKGNLPLTVDKKYVVSGVRKRGDIDFFYIVSDDNESHMKPWWYPSALFEVTDQSTPDDWEHSELGINHYFTFPELANDAGGFENNLEDGAPEELAIFHKYYEVYSRQYDTGPLEK